MAGYKITFKNTINEDIVITLDVKGKTGGYEELLPSDDCLTINQKSDELFAPLKPLSCTIKINTHDFISDLYTVDPQGVQVKITKNEKRIFSGYVTPCIYSQEWDYLNELEIECVSAISTLEYYDYPISTDNSFQTFLNVFRKILRQCNIYDNTSRLYISNSLYTAYDTTSEKGNILNDCVINEFNFIDDDEEGTIWKSKEVLEEICKTLGVSLIEFENHIMLLDYESLAKPITTKNYSYYYILSDIKTFSTPSLYVEQNITDKKLYADSGQTISMEDIYGRININANYYKDESNLFDVFNEDDLICLHAENFYYKVKATNQSAYYDDYETVDRTDYFRFYINKKYIHNFYPINGDSKSGFSIGSATEITEQQLINWRSYTSLGPDNERAQTDFKQYFIDNFVKKNAGCFIVKHMQMKGKPGMFTNFTKKNKWDTYLLVSYGLTFTTGSEDEKSASATKLFKQLCTGIYNMSWAYPMIITRDVKTICLLGHHDSYSNQNYKTWIKSKGQIQFMKNLYMDVSPDKVQHLPLIEAYNVLGGDMMYNLREYADSGSRQQIFYAPAAVEPPSLLNRWKGNILYKWIELAKVNMVNSGVVDPDAYFKQVETTLTSKLSLGFPAPHTGMTTSCPLYALLKDVKINVDRSYDMAISINGEVPKDDVVYFNNTEFTLHEDYDLDLRINTQHTQRELSISSILLATNDGLVYAGDKSFKSKLNPNSGRILEEFIVNKYYNHFKEPRLRYDVVLEGFYPNYIRFKENYINRYFVVDGFEYNVRMNQTNYNLIEY